MYCISTVDNPVSILGAGVGIKEKLILPSGVTAQTQSLFEYWCSLRGQDIVPSRSDLQPGAILPLLPNLMILEYREPGTLIYRLAGTSSVEILGVDFTGSNLYDHLALHQRSAAELRFNTLRAHPCGLIAHEKLRSKHQTPFVVEIIYLPLRDRDGEITQLIGSATTIKRGENESGAGEAEAMTAIAVDFLDIGAGLPQSLPSEARRAG